MKKVYALCLITLAAVLMDIVFLHPSAVTAQTNHTVHVDRVLFRLNTMSSDARVNGPIVGFHCVDTPGGPQCFVASEIVPSGEKTQ
jgi:hypothetical protein